VTLGFTLEGPAPMRMREGGLNSRVTGKFKFYLRGELDHAEDSLFG
jgi:hypothetical protein